MGGFLRWSAADTPGPEGSESKCIRMAGKSHYDYFESEIIPCFNKEDLLRKNTDNNMIKHVKIQLLIMSSRHSSEQAAAGTTGRLEVTVHMD